MPVLVLGSACLGLAVGLAAWAGADHWQRGLDAIETDFRDKLRRLRVYTKNLRASGNT